MCRKNKVYQCLSRPTEVRHNWILPMILCSPSGFLMFNEDVVINSTSMRK